MSAPSKLKTAKNPQKVWRRLSEVRRAEREGKPRIYLMAENDKQAKKLLKSHAKKPWIVVNSRKDFVPGDTRFILILQGVYWKPYARYNGIFDGEFLIHARAIIIYAKELV
jgi:hypothetical protein